MDKLLRLLQTLDNLSRIPRTGGVLFAGIDPNRVDSIAEHSYKVSCLCLLLGEAARKKGLKVNLEALLKTAIAHDWSDSVLLDIPTGSPSYKSYFQEEFRSVIKTGEKIARETIEKFVEKIAKLDLSEDSLSAAEKNLLDISDILALLIEILEWKYQGLKYEWFDYVWSNTLKRLEEKLAGDFNFLKPLAAELKKLYKSGIKPPNPFLTKPKFQTHKK